MSLAIPHAIAQKELVITCMFDSGHCIDIVIFIREVNITAGTPINKKPQFKEYNRLK